MLKLEQDGQVGVGVVCGIEEAKTGRRGEAGNQLLCCSHEGMACQLSIVNLNSCKTEAVDMNV